MPMTVEKVAALYELVDKGPLECACDGDPAICTCAEIMALCIEWMELKGYNPQTVALPK